MCLSEKLLPFDCQGVPLKHESLLPNPEVMLSSHAQTRVPPQFLVWYIVGGDPNSNPTVIPIPTQNPAVAEVFVEKIRAATQKAFGAAWRHGAIVAGLLAQAAPAGHDSVISPVRIDCHCMN